MSSLPYLDAAAIQAALPWHRAIPGIEAALRTGVDPESDAPRLFSPTPTGEFLLMPASAPDVMGVKVLTIAPENPHRGLAKIQGTYILFDADTSAPICVMDGAAITSVRTPAITLTGLRALAAAAPTGHELPTQPQIVVFGAGVQGLNHIRAIRWVWPDAEIAVVGRRPERVASLMSALADDHITITDATADPEAATRSADVIITVTSSRTPVIHGSWVADNALVASVGQHGLDAREVDAELVLRSDVLLESRTGMFREGGNIIPARTRTEWEQIHPSNLADAVAGEFRRTPGRPALYTGVGMSWEDLVLAGIAYRAIE